MAVDWAVPKSKFVNAVGQSGKGVTSLFMFMKQ